MRDRLLRQRRQPGEGSRDRHLVTTFVNATNGKSIVENMSAIALGVIVLVRTFLSFSIEIELDGVVPWRRRATQGAGSAGDDLTPPA